MIIDTFLLPITSIDAAEGSRSECVDPSWNFIEVEVRFETRPRSLYSGNHTRSFWAHFTPVCYDERTSTTAYAFPCGFKTELFYSPICSRKRKAEAMQAARGCLRAVANRFSLLYGLTIDTTDERRVA